MPTASKHCLRNNCRAPMTVAASFCPRCGLRQVAAVAPAALPPQPAPALPISYAVPPSYVLPAGMARTSMILGIVSICLFCMFYISIPCALLAVIFAMVARGKIRRGQASGAGMARAGTILGYISLILMACFVAGVLVVAQHGGHWR